MRRTHALATIAAVLVDDPDARHWGYGLSKASGVRSGVMYPLLARLLAAGHIADGWENPAEVNGRPPRRYYVLTEQGRVELAAVASEARRSSRRRS